MRLPRPHGRWWRVAGLVLWLAVGLALTWWIVSTVEDPPSAPRIAAAVAIVVVLVLADLVQRPLAGGLEGRRAQLFRAVSAVAAIAALVAYAALLGVVRQFAGAIIGMTLGYALRGWRDLRPRTNRYDENLPLLGGRSAVDAGDDGPRWRTGEP